MEPEVIAGSAGMGELVAAETEYRSGIEGGGISMNETNYKMTLERKTERGDPVITVTKVSSEQYKEIVEKYVQGNAGRNGFAEVVEKRVRELDRKREQESKKKKVKRK